MPISWSDRRWKAYTSERSELVRFVRDERGPVLDVGCGAGALGEALKRKHTRFGPVYGIEKDPLLARQAASRLELVLEGDAVDRLRNYPPDAPRPRLVIFADVLEHLVDPWTAFDIALELVETGGAVVVSVPNIAFWETFYHLLRGRWPQRDRGLWDDTHLRQFAFRNVHDLMTRGPATLERVDRVYRFIDRPTPINRLAGFIGWVAPNLFTYQYLALARIGMCSREHRR